MRKSNFEFIRIIACLLVITLHFGFYHLHYPTKAFFTSVAVPSFFMITGFFLFSKRRDYQKLIKSNYLRISISCLFLILFTFFFKSCIYEGSSISMSLYKLDPIFLLKGIVTSIFITIDFGSLGSLFPHFWYLRVYFCIILSYPLFLYLCTNKKENNLCRRISLITLILYAIFCDLSNIFRLDSSYTRYITLFYSMDSIMYLLLGYELSLVSEKLFNGKKKNILFGLILFFIGIVFTYIYKNIAIVNRKYYYGSRESFINLFKSLGFFILASNIGLVFKNSKTINWISSKTFGIFIIHFTVILIFNNFLKIPISEKAMYRIPVVSQIFLEIFYTLLIFIISLILVVIIEKIYSLFKYWFIDKRKRIKSS